MDRYPGFFAAPDCDVPPAPQSRREVQSSLYSERATLPRSVSAIMTQREAQHQGGTTQSLIRKLTTEKAVKAHRQQTSEKDASEDDITNMKLSERGIKTIESLDLPSLR